MKREVDRKIERNQLEEQLYRRWELLVLLDQDWGLQGDFGLLLSIMWFTFSLNKRFPRRLPTMCSFPFTSSSFEAQTDANSVEDISGAYANSSAKQLMATIDRVSYSGASDLLLPPDDDFLRFP